MLWFLGAWKWGIELSAREYGGFEFSAREYGGFEFSARENGGLNSRRVDISIILNVIKLNVIILNVFS